MEQARGVVQYQQNRNIDGQDYKFIVFSPTKSITTLVEISKLLGQPFAEMAVGIKSAKSKKEKDDKAMEMLPKVVKALVMNLNDTNVLEIIKSLMVGVECDGKQIGFDRHFQGRLGHLMKVVYAATEVQYEDFFSALVEMMSGDLMGASQE